jgi:nitroreductase
VASGDTRLELGRILSQTTVYLGEYVDELGPNGFDRAVAWFSTLGDAPVLVFVTAPESDDEMTATNRMLSVGTAVENLLLAATADGLGGCPFTFSFWVRAELAKRLALPEGRTVACVIALGWPSPGVETPRRAPHSDAIVWLD